MTIELPIWAVLDEAARLASRGVLNPAATQAFYTPSRLLDNLYKRFDEPYAQHSWFFAGAQAISVNVSQVPLQIASGDEESPIYDKEGEWRELFDAPNPLMGGAQLHEAEQTHVSCTGEVMLVKEGHGDARIQEGEIPFELWPINGRLFDPVLDAGKSSVIAWVYRPPGSSGMKPIIYEPHELIHIKTYNPYRPLRGLGCAEVLQLSLRQDWKAVQWNEAFFDNDACPGGVLMAPGDISSDQIAEIREAWQDRHQGYTKRSRVAVLKGGMEYVPITSNQKDMDFIKLRELTREEVLGVLKVPESEVSLHKNLNNATAISADKGFWTKTLIPRMRLVEDAYWAQLFAPVYQMTRRACPGTTATRSALRKCSAEFGVGAHARDARYRKRVASAMLGRALSDEVLGTPENGAAINPGARWAEFDLSTIEALRENLDIKANTAKTFVDLGYPVNMVNERLDLGMPELDETAMPSGAPQPGAPGSLSEEVLGGNAQPASLSEEVLGKGTFAALHNGDEITDEQRDEASTWLTRRRPDREKRYKAIGKLIDAHESKFLRKLTRFFIELRTEQLKRLGELELPYEAEHGVSPEQRAKKKRTPREVLFDESKWDKILIKHARPLYVEAFQDAAAQASTELGGSFGFDVQDPRVLEFLAKRELTLLDAPKTVRNRLMKELEQGLAAKESIDSLADRFKRQFNFSASRAQRVARTEVAGTVNGARFEVLRQEGVEKQEWLTAKDEAVRPSHADIDGEIVDIGQPFSNGLRYPGEVGGDAGEVINCRCTVVPVIGRATYAPTQRDHDDHNNSSIARDVMALAQQVATLAARPTEVTVNPIVQVDAAMLSAQGLASVRQVVADGVIAVTSHATKLAREVEAVANATRTTVTEITDAVKPVVSAVVKKELDDMKIEIPPIKLEVPKDAIQVTLIQPPAPIKPKRISDIVRDETTGKIVRVETEDVPE